MTKKNDKSWVDGKVRETADGLRQPPPTDERAERHLAEVRRIQDELAAKRQADRLRGRDRG